MFPCKAQCRLLVAAHDHTPFFFGYSLTMYVAGKWHATKIHSGSDNTFNSNGTSPIHMPFANDNAGVFFLCKEDVNLHRYVLLIALAHLL
jgi:hypothetical protein